ncbi:MAG: UPF0489 family protein [Planctomycetia bacterium]|nr:UPF0489 family protein [Planctomycetia bacterium]
MTIPCVLMEEHHEAFLVWELARQKGWLPAEGSCLVHVDAHSDLSLPVLRTSLGALSLEPAALREFVYSELTVASFILASIYRGVFNRMLWIQNDTSDAHEKLLHVYSMDRQGRSLRITTSIRQAGAFNPQRRHFGLRSVRCAQAIDVADPWALDIDLDYFSTNDQRQFAQVEVTQLEYERFHSDRYHPLRTTMGAQVHAVEVAGRYFLQADYSDAWEPGHGRVDEATIKARMGEFGQALRRLTGPPRVITICRSAISGYTPADQVELIQSLLFDELAGVYPLERIACDAL